MSTEDKRPHRVYDEKFKADAVAMVTDLGKPRAEVARDFEIAESTLGRWVAKATGTEGTGRGNYRKPAEMGSDDIVQLRKRNAELEQENAFLKKAAAFFAKEQP